jgi:tetratricopeptide (TPR) repeat protein
MLFDLRSRGRRRTVQVVYIGLAILIGSGLVLFGVGTGGSGGGLFGALTGSSSTSGGAAITSQTKKALAATRKTPSSASAWASLVDARFSAANSVGYDSSTSTYTPAGKQQLTLLTVAYRRYLKLARTPTVDTITIAAHAYSQLDQYANAADAYQAVLQIQPGNLKGLECVSFLSYAAGNDDLAELAQAKVLGKLPKSARKEVKAQLQEAKTDKSVATESC